MIPTDQGFYKDLLDHISDGVYFVDRDRRILFWNEGAYRLTMSFGAQAGMLDCGVLRCPKNDLHP
jgi:hypothetical protein